MRITYDADANAAYITIGDDVADGAAVQQLHSIETPGGLGEITLDFDSDGRLLGVEVINAEEVLPVAVLDSARTDRAFGAD